MRLKAAMFLLAMLPFFSKAAIVNRQYEITLFNDVGHYSAGHVFRLSATYDDASYEYSIWQDGANGKAEFGAGDDSLVVSLASTFPASDAALSLTGLVSPPVAGLIPDDVNPINTSSYFEFPDPFVASQRNILFELRADDTYFQLNILGSNAYNLIIFQYYKFDTSEITTEYNTLANSENSRLQILTSVPEPSAISLAGAAMAVLLLIQHVSRRTGPVARSRLARRSVPAIGE